MTTELRGFVHLHTLLYSCLQFSLSEVASITAVDPEDCGELFCFRVSQPPLQMILRCRTMEERRYAACSMRLTRDCYSYIWIPLIHHQTTTIT